VWTALTLLACQEPFGADRHDLVGFRIAAVTVPAAEPGEAVVPRVALVVDGRPWAPVPAALRWTWVADADEVATLDPQAPADGVGAAPSLTVPDGRPVLALIATAQGQEARAFVTVPSPPAALDPIAGFEVAALPLSVEDVTAEALQLDARRRLDPVPADPIDPGGFARLEAEVPGDPLVRWMATAGTFFELDRRTADWAAGELRLDGDEVDEDFPRIAIDPGWVTVLALALSDGETTFEAVDLPVGLAGRPPGLWLGGRFLPADAEISVGAGEQVRGTLRADDASPCGLTLTGGRPEPLGTPSAPLPCDPPVDGAFHPELLFEQRCGRDVLDGVEVVALPAGGR
jgi:hypothetical protein